MDLWMDMEYIILMMVSAFIIKGNLKIISLMEKELNIPGMVKIYEGDYVNSLKEGDGRFNQPNGDYYIGQFYKDVANGKGTQYNVFGKIIYEGDFVDGNINGNGKLFYEEGSYYKGEFKDGKRHGFGEEYDKNWVKLRFVTYENGECVKSDEVDGHEEEGGENGEEEGGREGAEGGEAEYGEGAPKGEREKKIIMVKK